MNKRSVSWIVGASIFCAVSSVGFADDNVTVEAIERDLLKVVDEISANGVMNQNGVLSASNVTTTAYGVQIAAYNPDASAQDPLLQAMANLSMGGSIKSKAVTASADLVRLPVKAKKQTSDIKRVSSSDSIELTPAVYRSVMNSSAPDIRPKRGKSRKSKRRSSYRPCYKFGYHELQQRASRYQKSITEASLRYGVSEHLIKSVITAESCFKVRARSRKGARGLMQLMPATARRFGVRRSYNSHQNIMGGTKYLRWLLDRFQGNLHKVLAGYNAGEGRVIRYGGIPPFRETIEYVRRVLGVYRTLRGKRTISYNETHPYALTKTRADYQRIWNQNQRRNQQLSRFRATKVVAAARGGASRLDQRRCSKAVPRNLTSISYLKRSGRGGSVWSRYYKVRRDQTLADIMKKSGVHINNLRRLNGQKTRFVPGQSVLLWECKA